MNNPLQLVARIGRCPLASGRRVDYPATGSTELGDLPSDALSGGTIASIACDRSGQKTGSNNARSGDAAWGGNTKVLSKQSAIRRSCESTVWRRGASIFSSRLKPSTLLVQ